jgi:hypothetical protein
MVGKYGETLVVDWGLAKATGHSVADAAASLPEAILAPFDRRLRGEARVGDRHPSLREDVEHFGGRSFGACAISELSALSSSPGLHDEQSA